MMSQFVRRLAQALLVAGAVCGVLVGTANAESMVIKHAQGETTLDERPVKVLTFDLGVLDTLTALGVEVAGVPTGNKPDYLKSYEDQKYIKVGTFFEPDYEAVNAAEPDLIIIGGRSAPKYADLSKIAPTIDLTIGSKPYLETAEQNIRMLAKIFGKESVAEPLLKKLESSATAVKNKASKAGTGLLVLTTGGKMSTYGPGSRFDVLFSDFGVVPADQTIKVGSHGQAVTFEYVLQENPDWLYVIDRDAAIGEEGTAAKAFLDNEIVAKTTAWKSNQVVYLDPVAWYLVAGGITSMQKSIDQLNEALSKS